MYRNREEETFYAVKKTKRDKSSDVYSEMGILNTITPCAACKLLRRRCAEECPFSPYFSPREPHKFAAVHKVFGASNVSKLLLEVGESQRADAANSLVYEANLRLRDPVYGCMGAISALEQQIQYLEAQLNAARAEIIRYKYREAIDKNVTFTSTTCHDTLLVSPSPSSPPPPPPPPATPPPPFRSVILSSSSSSSVSSLYTPPTASSNGYTSISSVDLPYFD
ncbi:LOB domain-containing protein 13 [Euphorbia lathyris]|uniref:LOB domain-containing protein 13 n=1 Tax=Euphorbia lathyris TaxID=212925 RepID=UPI003313381C